jgi:hypothetical protein
MGLSNEDAAPRRRARGDFLRKSRFRVLRFYHPHPKTTSPSEKHRTALPAHEKLTQELIHLVE